MKHQQLIFIFYLVFFVSAQLAVNIHFYIQANKTEEDVKIDLIYNKILKSNQLISNKIKFMINQIDSEKDIVINNFDNMFWIRNLDNLQSQIFSNHKYSILDIINPKLEFLETEEDVNQYFNKIQIKLFGSFNYTFKGQIIENLESKWRFKGSQNRWIERLQFQLFKFTAPTLLLYKVKNKFEQYEYNLTYTDQILDLFYLESLDLINRLDEDNYAKVFGGPAQTQVHLQIEDILSQDLLNSYFLVSQNNKLKDFKYHRLIFIYSTFQENPS